MYVHQIISEIMTPEEGRPRGPEHTDPISQPEEDRAGMTRRGALRAMFAGAAALTIAGAACDRPDVKAQNDAQVDPEYAKYQPLQFLYLFPHVEGFDVQYLNNTASPVHVVVSYENGDALADFEAEVSDGDNPKSFILPIPREGTEIVYISIDGNEEVLYRIPNVTR